MKYLITGGTGTLGRALVAHLLSRPETERVVVFSRDEVKQADMAAEYAATDPAPLRFFLGDVRDPMRLAEAFHEIDIVVHAAALKRVDALAYHPWEATLTNVIGTHNVVRAALSSGVQKVLFVSSDKAVQAENLYGGTKFLAEQNTLSFNAISKPNGLACAAVRYGNVFNSRGSVVSIWRRQRAAGQALMLTDARMTRFVITKPQAVELVMNALEVMVGGEIFVPCLPSMRLVDLARVIADGQVPVVAGEWRPGGEKLHERLLSDEEPRRTLYHPHCGFYIVMPSHHPWTASPGYRGQLVSPDLLYRSDGLAHGQYFLTEKDLATLLEGEPL